MNNLFKKISNISLVIIFISNLTIIPVYASEINNTPDFGTTIDQEIGMNGFIDDPIEILTAGGIVREYHNYGWSQGSTPEMNFKNGTWWDFDNYYKTLHDAGVTIFPCIQQGSTTLLINNTNRENKPTDEGADTLNPESYKIHANYLFNYAARYGSTKVDNSKLSVVSSEEKKSGLGYIKYYENWNEPDKTWQGERAHFSPEELAAMCSADYDGHEGTIGDTYGIKQADPNSKLVYGGLAGGSAGVEYLNRMKAWSEENRTDKNLPFDVINFHMYLGRNCPEQSDFVENASKIVNWRNTNAPDKEVWLTEFGWDTNTESVMAAPNEDTQRDWIIREYLIANRIGINRSTVYCSRDVAPASDTTKYSTCGLTTQKGEQAKKSSWYGLKTLKTTLTGYKLSNIIKEDNEMYVYEYRKENSNEICYALWCPTQENKILNDCVFDMTNMGNISNATLTELKDGEENGLKTDLTITDGKIKINVSESPIFITIALSEESKKQEEPAKNNEENQINGNENENNNQKNNTENKEINENTNKQNNSQKENNTNTKEEGNSKKDNSIVNNTINVNTNNSKAVKTSTDTTIANKPIPQAGDINITRSITIVLIILLSIGAIRLKFKIKEVSK